VTDWLDEGLHGAVQQRLRIDRLIYRGKTDFQSIEIFENSTLGRVLVLDGVVQTTEADEHVYHEMMTHVPLVAHGAAKRVLIIGGGDGGILEEVLKHPVEHVTMVELDPQVTALCREHIPSICGKAFEDARTELLFTDGARFVAETDQRYDVVIVDSPDPIGPAQVLFESPFYAGCKRCLNDGGIMVTQNGVPFLQGGEVTSTHGHLKKLFAHTGFYVSVVPTYYGGFMAHGWACDSRDIRDLSRDEIAARIAALGFDTRYHNADIQAGAFALPSFIRQLMQ
jgi:spermidine synthase